MLVHHNCMTYPSAKIHTFNEIYLHDLKAPVRRRLEARKFCGPYRWRPAVPGIGRGFYSSMDDQLVMGDSTFRLRLEKASNFRQGRAAEYWCDADGFNTLLPVIARLPRGRGFLAGWTMGAGMMGAVDARVFDDEYSAALWAHRLAEHDAEVEASMEAAGY